MSVPLRRETLSRRQWTVHSPMPTSTMTAGVVDQESCRPSEGRRSGRQVQLHRRTGIPGRQAWRICAAADDASTGGGVVEWYMMLVTCLEDNSRCCVHDRPEVQLKRRNDGQRSVSKVKLRQYKSCDERLKDRLRHWAPYSAYNSLSMPKQCERVRDTWNRISLGVEWLWIVSHDLCRVGMLRWVVDFVAVRMRTIASPSCAWRWAEDSWMTSSLLLRQYKPTYASAAVRLTTACWNRTLACHRHIDVR